MIVIYEGREYTLDIGDGITYKQARVLQDFTGLTLQQWGSMNFEPAEDAGDDDRDFLTYMASVYWLMLAQSGENVPIDEVDFRLVPLSEALAGAFADEIEARKKAAPAKGPGSVPTQRPATSRARSKARSTRTAGTSGTSKTPGEVVPASGS